ncbi:MAG: phosphoribosylformylglycinamidine cyclo-ligase [Syntrophomonadaceae bacterium]|nr:phosphoribosylformylglycinamidine cyclo-ligase [Syntrophomonadaceae bacterium]
MDKGMTYKKAGVDLEAADKSVDLIRKWIKRTHRKEVLSDIGSFGGFFSLDIAKYKQPVLVSGTDGVGTKLRIAQMMGIHDTVGIDLVAMSVNDILVHGAEPLFFLDYIAVGKLNPTIIELLVKGVSAACLEAGCALIGGETAEMPGFYQENEYDLAGFAVGVVDKTRLIDGASIKDQDIIIGLPSSGLHSNGYSLARKVLLEEAGLKLEDYSDNFGKTLGEELLTPTRLYPGLILPLLDKFRVKGMAHITGGGIPENLARIIPKGLGAVIDSSCINILPVFDLIRTLGQISKEEMFRTFNMGIGYIAVVSPLECDQILKHLQGIGEKPIVIGRISSSAEGVIIE